MESKPRTKVHMVEVRSYLLSFQLPAAFGINAQQVKKLTAVVAKSHIGEPYRATR